MHTPVMISEALDALQVHHGGRYIDCTGGEGGYTREIVNRGGAVLTFDADAAQAQNLRMLFENDRNVTVVHSNFRDLARVAKELGWQQVDGIVFDLGLSFKQMIQGGKGFSFKMEEDALDMRIGNTGTTAAHILNTYTEDELVTMLEKNAEETQALSIAMALVQKRQIAPFQTVRDLNSVLQAFRSGPDVRARVYQALRIEVNEEFTALTEALEGATDVIAKGKPIVVVSFHSREDRLVKQFARNHGLKLTKPTIRRTLQSFEQSATIKIITT